MNDKKPRISLCVITGNAENYIERFLTAFQPHFDETVIVRACGNQPADGTLDIAKRRKCKVGYYNNEIDWPHDDNFGAARNKASELATGDWLIWADTDDVITKDSGEQIRRLIDDIHTKDIQGVLMRYVVPEDGVVNWRERIWRKGSARWINPVHECLEFEPDAKQIRFDGAEIVHASEKRSASRDERNLRILQSIPEAERTTSQKFHAFQSLIALDRNDEAIQGALEFVQSEGIGANEKYEAFFQLARLAQNDTTKRQMLLQALATDPTRREAFGELGLASIMDNPSASLGWTEAMMALSIPQDGPWNLRRTYYGHLGVSLRGMALRANQRHEEADALEVNHFIRNGGMISLLHATRGRPAKAWRARMDWLRTASNPDAVEHIFAVDVDDLESYPLTNSRCVLNHHNAGCVGAWNAAADACKGDVMVQLSDDFEPFPGWDTAILNAIGDTSKPAVLAVSDGNRTDDLLCMAICTRARWEQQGRKLFHPEFFSMFSDNWFSERAFADGVVIDARNSITFEHMHPAFGKAEMDETYARSNDGYNYKAGEGIMQRLRSGQKVSAEIHGWFDFRDVYDHVAKSIPEDGQFVEVGSWKGKSAIYLRDRLDDIGKDKVKLVCVDTFCGDSDTGEADVLEDFLANTSGRAIVCNIGTSIDQADATSEESLDGVFIDAAHDYANALADIQAWKSKVKPGGFFGGHDADSQGVQQALADAGINFITIGRCWIQQPKQP